MEYIRNCLFVGLGGAIGAVGRYLLGLLPIRTRSGFPAVTLLINVAGAFMIGLITALVAKRESFNPYVLLFVKVGICGGFTTFSAFSLEAAGLLRNGQHLVAWTYMALSVILCLAAVAGGQAVIK